MSWIQSLWPFQYFFPQELEGSPIRHPGSTRSCPISVTAWVQETGSFLSTEHLIAPPLTSPSRPLLDHVTNVLETTSGCRAPIFSNQNAEYEDAVESESAFISTLGSSRLRPTSYSTLPSDDDP